jgi:hypothetical protein
MIEGRDQGVVRRANKKVVERLETRDDIKVVGDFSSAGSEAISAELWQASPMSEGQSKHGQTTQFQGRQEGQEAQAH